ncbi:MAG: cytochrome P450 [Myxococcota bacterium]
MAVADDAATRADALADIDLYDADRYAEGAPYEAFARLRRADPVHWQPEPEGPGYWAVLRHADVLAVARDIATFSSERGSVMIEDLSPPALARMRRMLLVMDPPRHGLYRRMVLHAFTPRSVDRLEPRVRAIARAALARARDEPELEFVHDVAARVPMEVIGELFGIPAADRAQVHAWAERSTGPPEPDGAPGEAPRARRDLETSPMERYAVELARDRRGREGDDLTTRIANARVEGRTMSDAEFGAFFVQMVTAGNDTTRTLLANGLLGLLRFPDELARLRGDRALLPTAVEEMLRWESPLHGFRRTATRDVELAGTRVREGDKVVMMYTSANRDERVFTEPDRFDAGRDPNPHLAFGFGEHFCLGAKLARLEARVFFDELLDAFGGVELAGAPVWQRSNLSNGLAALPVRFAPARGRRPS